MATAAKVDGQDKVIATAQHIVKSLATSAFAEEDMLRILSGFDNRLCDLLPSPSPTAPSSSFDAAEHLILRWDSSTTDSLLWESDESADYLAAVDLLISLLAPQPSPSDLTARAETALQISMARLEDEFCHLIIRNAIPLQPRSLYTSISRLSISRISISMNSDGGTDTLDDDNDPSLNDANHHTTQHENNMPHRSGSGSRSRSRSGSGSALLEELNIDLIHPEAVADLKDIADRMIWAGYGKELSQVYCSVRREILDECLCVLGIDRMSIEEVQKLEWSALSDKMKKWISAVKVVVRVLLADERRICEQIFEESEELMEECFAESAKGCIMQLLNFGDAIAIGRRSSEKLFGILDMCETLTNELPDLEALFPQESRHIACEEANGILNRLADAVRGTLTEFGNQIQKESSRKALQGCEIHPLTRYVMNYVKFLVVYNGLLDILLDDGEEDCSDDGDNMSPTGRRLLLLISYLEANLVEKSKLYEDVGMQYIFLMNNLLYIVQKVKDSELRSFLGDDWIRKRRGQIRQYSTSYLRASWTKILSYLKDDGLSGSGSSSSGLRTAIKERFKNFNLTFEELHRTQSAWKVPDPQLREELRISISEKIIPAYRSFMGRFSTQLEGGRHTAKYIKYNSEDLETHLSDLFEGLPGMSSHPRRKLSSS